MWSKHDVEHHHKRRYTMASLQAVVEKSGLELQKISYYNTLLLPLIAAIRGVKALLGNTEPDTGVPPRWLNAILEAIFGLEQFLIGRIPMPLGVSLIMVSRAKPA
jgi:hypothetical protein